MLAANKTVTLLHLDADEQYHETVIEGVSWFEQRRAQVQERGAVYASEVKVRIPAARLPEGARLCVGDTLVLGRLVSPPTSPRDLRGLHKAELVHVGDNRRGGLPHWAVTGK